MTRNYIHIITTKLVPALPVKLQFIICSFTEFLPFCKELYYVSTYKDFSISFRNW